jgi:hypothetical protein
MFLIYFLVEVAQKFDRFDILAATKPVGQPLAVLAGIIEVQHRGYRVHAQTVGVVLVQPEHRARK